jgi:hypothetical protein
MTRFGKFWAGHTISQFGDRITDLALPLIAVTMLAATPAQVGLLTAAVWAPNLLSLLVGSWVDGRTHRKRLLVAADLLRAAVLLSLPVTYWLGAVTLAQLFTVAILAGIGQVLFSAAYPSFFVSLVPATATSPPTASSAPAGPRHPSPDRPSAVCSSRPSPRRSRCWPTPCPSSPPRCSSPASRPRPRSRPAVSRRWPG